MSLRRAFHDDIHDRARSRFKQANGEVTEENIDQYESFYLEAAR